MGNFAAQWVTMTAIMASLPLPPKYSYFNIVWRICNGKSWKGDLRLQLIRSIWEVDRPPLKILLEVIIAPLRDLLHSYNFNHHQTNYPQNHSTPNLAYLLFALCSALMWAANLQWDELRNICDTGDMYKWLALGPRKEIFCPQSKLCESETCLQNWGMR